MLSKGVAYQELGSAYLDHHDKTRTANNLVRRLERLGFDVEIKAAKSRENTDTITEENAHVFS
jgi:hypothetical protein